MAVTVGHDFVTPALQFIPEGEIAQRRALDVGVLGRPAATIFRHADSLCFS